MKTTKEMEDVFLRFGHPEEDLRQLKKAIREADLTLTEKKTGKEAKINSEKAVEILGMETFLSGISRSAFHASAVRESKDGKYSVYFDLSKWW